MMDPVIEFVLRRLEQEAHAVAAGFGPPGAVRVSIVVSSADPDLPWNMGVIGHASYDDLRQALDLMAFAAAERAATHTHLAPAPGTPS